MSKSAKVLDDALALVLILAIIGFLAWAAFQLKEILTGGSASPLAGGSSGGGYSPSFKDVLTSDVPGPIPSAYGSTLANMVVDAQENEWNFYKGIWTGFLDRLGFGGENQATQSQAQPAPPSTDGTSTADYIPPVADWLQASSF